jgi:signal transduction histidine kinase
MSSGLERPASVSPAIGLREALSEKAFAAERGIARLRLIVIAANTLIYLVLTDKSGPLVSLAYAVIAFAWVYGLYVYLSEPYRRFAVFLSAYFSSITDAAFIILWLWATGGFYSAFYVLLYPAVVSVAFRFTARATASAALVYSSAYLGLLLALNEVAGHLQELVVRITYVFLTAGLGHLISKEALEQAKRKISYSAFLAEASRVLAASLNHEAGLRALARLVVPAFADSCTVELLEGDAGLTRRLVQATSEGGDGSGGQNEPHLQPIREELASVLRSGRTWFLNTARPSSFIVAIVGRRIHGAITFEMDRSGRRFTPAEIAIGESLGQRAAVAVEHSILYREAQDAIQARDDFLSVASHELNTPLTTLQLQMDLLLRQGRGEERQAPSRLELARRQVVRLRSLIRDLLDASRISSGKLPLELEDVDLCEVVHQTVERAQEACRRVGSPLDVRCAGSVVGRWDRMRLEHVVSNLLNNAIKYGEGKRIELSVEQIGDRARLKVQDFGIGMEPKEQARIFDRFARAHSARCYSGFGLGLWIVQRVVGELGGRIEVFSKPGQGSTFVVELPLSRPRGSEGGAQSSAASTSAQVPGALG